MLGVISDRRHGPPRMHTTLRAPGVRSRSRRVARLMLQQGLRGVCRRRRKGKLKRTGTVVLASAPVRQSCHAGDRIHFGWQMRPTSRPRKELSIGQRFQRSVPAVSWVGRCPPGRMPSSLIGNRDHDFAPVWKQVEKFLATWQGFTIDAADIRHWIIGLQ